MADPGKAVFLSYASQDADAVRQLADSLRAAGVEVWFDQNELVGGDAWDAKIRKQIAECALFVPVISTATEARREGYFRIEWRLAAQRTHAMSDDTPFLLPVVIDETRDAEAKVPVEFRAVQWTRLLGTVEHAAFMARVKHLLGIPSEVGAPPFSPQDTTRPKINREDSPPDKWVPLLRFRTVMFGATALVVLSVALWSLFRSTKKIPSLPLAKEVSPPAASKPVSEARQQMERARAILDNSLRSRATYDAAEEIMRRALVLDATDAEVWAMAARVDANFYQIYDRSSARREQLLQRSAKAIALAPKDWEPRQSRAWAFTVTADGDSSMLMEAEKIYRQLLLERPDDRRANNGLAETLKQKRQFEEAAKLFLRAGNSYSAGWAYVSARQYPAARAVADREIANAPTAGILKLKIYVETFGFEDLDAAQAASARLTATDLMDDEIVSEAARLAVLRRDAAEILRLMKIFPGERIDSVIFRGSKHTYIGVAHFLAGRMEAANSEWRIALQQTEAHLKISGSDSATLLAAADLHALLGDKATATNLLRQVRSLSGREPDSITAFAEVHTEIALGRLEEAMTRVVDQKRDPTPYAHTWARYHFRFDPLRGDPRFEKFLRDTLPRGAKPFAEAGAVSASKTEKK